MADVELKDQGIVTAHCPNSGSMKECCEPGRPVYLSYHDNPNRKLKYTWELIQMPTSLVGVNTLVPNRLTFKAIQSKKINKLSGFNEIKREVATSKGSRIDLMLGGDDTNRCYVEVKNCTLVEDKIAYFPDAVTARGLKHLTELQRLAHGGCRCIMFYLIQRMDAAVFKPADHIDPDYGKGLRKAVNNGVEILVYDVKIDLKTIRLNKEIPWLL
jgi:sugar fermentation stimulation protein A